VRVSPSDLPSALRDVAKTTGLEYLSSAPLGFPRFPVACAKFPVFGNPEEDIARLPIQPNFHFAVLDMDVEKDRKEYETTMSYLAAGYGAKLVHIERVFVTKAKKNEEGQEYEEQVRRVYLEYYAPYRIIPPTMQNSDG